MTECYDEEILGPASTNQFKSTQIESNRIESNRIESKSTSTMTMMTGFLNDGRKEISVMSQFFNVTPQEDDIKM